MPTGDGHHRQTVAVNTLQQRPGRLGMAIGECLHDLRKRLGRYGPDRLLDVNVDATHPPFHPVLASSQSSSRKATVV